MVRQRNVRMIFFCDIASDAESCRRLIAILDSTGENLRALKTGREELEKVSVIITLSTCTILNHQLLLRVLKHNPVEFHKLDNLFCNLTDITIHQRLHVRRIIVHLIGSATP